MNNQEIGRPIPPDHLESSFQHPVQAAKIFLDRAIAIIKENEKICPQDKDWFVRYCHWMIEEIDPKWLTKQL